MCSWINPSTGKFKTQRGEPLNEGTEEDNESEDQIIYRHDLPNELLGVYQQRHQVKAQGSSHRSIAKEKKRPQETCTKVLVPPSAVEEAAWAALTAACPTLNRPATAAIQGELHGNGPRKISWAEALEQLINHEVHRDEKRAPIDLQATQLGDAHADVDLAQTTSNLVKHGAHTVGQIPIFKHERKFDTFGFSKGKEKHHTAERLRINNLKAPQTHLQEGSAIPLAQRLQEFAKEDSRHNDGPRQAGGATYSSSSLTITEKLQSLIESSASPQGYHEQIAGTKVSRQSPFRSRRPVSTVKINRTSIQDDIVDCLDRDEDDSGVQGSSRFLENPVQRSRSARIKQNSHLVYRDEPLEDIENYEEFFDQEPSTAKSISGATSAASTSILERFHDALLSAPPDGTCTDGFGFSARLETLLSAQKSKHVHFTKSLQRKQQGGNLEQCLEVLVLGTIDQAQLTTCRCEVLRSPETWNKEGRPQNVSVENAQKASVIDVIFSKVSSGVELHVGCIVRIHPPWQEVPRAGQPARLLVCTFFCEVLR